MGEVMQQFENPMQLQDSRALVGPSNSQTLSAGCIFLIYLYVWRSTGCEVLCMGLFVFVWASLSCISADALLLQQLKLRMLGMHVSALRCVLGLVALHAVG